MILTSTDVIVSASDLKTFGSCQFSFLRRVDVLLGRATATHIDDPFLEQLVQEGRAHERRTDERLRARYGDFVVAPRPAHPYSPASLAAAAEATVGLIRQGHSVISQAVLFADGIFAIPDYLIRQSDGSYAVWDAKLAQTVKADAQLQLAICSHLLVRMGLPTPDFGGVFTGKNTDEEVDLTELRASVLELTATARRMFTDHQRRDTPAPWNDEVTPCGKCNDCKQAIEEHQDVKLVYKLKMGDRARLRAAGVTTVQELADSTGPVDGMSDGRLVTLRAQAALQTQHVVHPDGTVTVAYEIYDRKPLDQLPAPSPGDVFFDFEGDTLFTDADGIKGIEYLWGLFESTADGGEYVHRWAEDRVAEREAVGWFIDRMTARLAAHPDLHIYHYNRYEVTALKKLTERYGVGQGELASWLNAGVFVDLYTDVVCKSLRTSQPGLSLKLLEPLYSPPRTAEVQSATASMVGFADYLKLLDADPVAAEQHRDNLIAYNRDDCVSTRGLRNWLRTA